MANGNSSSTSGGGISFIGLLTIVFITLKLTGYITWSWWWVLSPIWISWIFIFLILIIVIVWAVMQDKKGFRRK
jgi:hypothetical protein